MPSKLSSSGVLFLKQQEGCRLDAYQDKGGVWTIGYGDTYDVQPGDRITMDEAERRFLARVAEFETAVLSAVKRPMTQGQFDSLVSLTYNIGGRGFAESQLCELFNAADLEGAARQFGRWIYVKGKLLQVRRGDKGENVAEWQRTLKAAGLVVRVDGDFGPATETATKLYQAKKGPDAIEAPPGVGVVREKEIDPVLVARRFWEVVRFLT